MTPALLLAALALAAAPSVPTGVDQSRGEAATILLGGLSAAAGEGLTSGQRLQILTGSAGKAAEALGAARAAQILRRQATDARWRALADETVALRWLERELERTAGDLTFEPLREAELPVGFPEPTPVLEIELKSYPAYRMASAPAGGLGGGFWTLFRHIESHEIAMTAPVEMTWAGSERLSEERMAFLYGSMEIGQTGPDGRVQVVDVEPTLVVSLGCRGRMSEARVGEARAELERWIAASGRFEIAGALRSMGYNSPMVPASKSFFEVEIPVRPKGDDKVAAAAQR